MALCRSYVAGVAYFGFVLFGARVAHAEIYHPNPALKFSRDLLVLETNERDAFNLNPNGGTPATAGATNWALVQNGGLGLESSRISETYGDDKINNGVYGVEFPDVDDATRPWIAADGDDGGWVGVLLAEAFDVGKIGFGSRFTGRADGVFTLQVTTDDFAGVDLEDPVQIDSLVWITVGTLESTTPGEFGRHLVTFELVEGVNAARIVVSQGGTTVTEIEVYEGSEYEEPPPDPDPDPRAPPTPYTEAVLADSPVHYYRFEETHTFQPAKDALGDTAEGGVPGAFQGAITAGEASAFERLGHAIFLDGTPGTLVNLTPAFHPGPTVSVEAWVYLDPTAAPAFLPIAARWDGSYELDVNAGSGRGNFVTRNDANTFALAETLDPFTRGEWHHVVGVFDEGVSTIYLDGVAGLPVDTSATGLNLQDSGATLFIGSTRDGLAFNWKGWIDEVAFYDYALTPEQIADHLRAANPDICEEERDRVAIDGRVTALTIEAVELTATLEGIDPGGSATFAWEILSGTGALSATSGAVVTLTGELGDVTVQVSANDGVCDEEVTAEQTVTFFEPGDPPAPPTRYTEAILADGPIHYYRFEETDTRQLAKDAIGQSDLGDQPGQFRGGVTAGEPSASTVLGSAALFDGLPGTLVDLGAPFHPGDSVSVEAWVWLDPAAVVAFHPIVARWDGSYELDVNEGSGLGNFVTRNDANEFALAETAAPFIKGEWHHMVGVFDGGLSTVYLDGQPGITIDTSASGTVLQDAGPTLLIGSTRDGNGFNWMGLIDEVAFYDYALTQEQIRAHLMLGLGGDPGPIFHRGDVNNDGAQNIADPIFLLNSLFGGGPSPTCRETADTNNDGGVNIADPIYLLNFQFGGGPPPPDPGPVGQPCGPDPEEPVGFQGCDEYSGC